MVGFLFDSKDFVEDDGEISVVVSITVCETVGKGSYPLFHPKIL